VVLYKINWGINLNLKNKNQITIKESAIECVDDPVERIIDQMVSDGYDADGVRKIWANLEFDYRKFGKGGQYTFTIKNEDELKVIQLVVQANCEWLDMQNDFGEEYADRSLGRYLNEKMNEIWELEI
tara:strand:+ start:124 stop:504 length:381 start_codon:yes stop_codon:yes gene_type:complete